MNILQIGRVCAQGILVAVISLAWAPMASAQENAVVTGDAYLYLFADTSRPPFARVEAGALVTMVRTEGDWVNIRIVDIDEKERYGYISARFVRRLAPAQPDVPTITAARTSTPAPAPASPVVDVASAAAEPPPPAPSPVPAASVLPSPPAATGPPVRLQDVRRLFIEEMPNDLHQYISAEITKQFKGRVTVVLTKETADAIMRGVSEARSGFGAAIAGRYLGLQDNASGSVALIDRGETVVLWASEAGDRSLLFGIARRGGQRKVAERLVNNLKDALNDGR